MRWIKDLITWAFGGLSRMAATALATGAFIVMVGVTPATWFAQAWSNPPSWLFDWRGRLIIIVVGLGLIGWSLHLRRQLSWSALSESKAPVGYLRETDSELGAAIRDMAWRSA